MRADCVARSSMLCSDLNEKEIQRRGDTCIHVADSLCCTTERNTTLKSNCTPIFNEWCQGPGKYNKKKKRGIWQTIQKDSLYLFQFLFCYTKETESYNNVKTSCLSESTQVLPHKHTCEQCVALFPYGSFCKLHDGGNQFFWGPLWQSFWHLFTNIECQHFSLLCCIQVQHLLLLQFQ